MRLNVIDRLIGAVNPKAGAERAAWRSQYEAYRGNYDAGDAGRLQSQWSTVNMSGEMTDRYDRDIVRARARDLERNSDMMNAVLRAFRRNVIGGGLQVRVTTGDPETDSVLEKAWEKWCRRYNCDVTGQQSFPQLVRMCIQRKITDGGVLIVKRYTNQGVLPFQLQVLEVDELDTTQVKPHRKENKVVGGIEYNRWNRPEGYWIRQYSIDGFTPMLPVYLEAKDVIFYHSRLRPSQIREISDLSSVLTRIKDANEFITAATVKEKMAACLALLIKRIIPQGPSGRLRGQAGPEVRYEGKRIVPGMIMEMNAGDEAQIINPAGQGTDASGFVKLQQRMISSATGLSYEATSRDMEQTTYSSARQSMIEDDLTYEEERELLTTCFLDEVYETFVISCWLKGLISPDDFWERKDIYFAHEWVTKPKRWIDPQKEANATGVALKTGQKTFQQICAENGRDWKKVVDEMAEAQDYAMQKGINLLEMIRGAQAADSGSDGKEDGEKEGAEKGEKDGADA